MGTQPVMTVVDCCDFKVLDRKLPDGSLDKGLYCHKTNGPGLRYEVCHGLYSGRICWVNGPFHCGRWNDLKIAKECGLVYMLQSTNERCIADSAYKHKSFFTPPGRRTPQSHTMNSARARQETVFSRLKGTWGCFKTVWRHSEDLHELAFHSTINILQMLIDLGETALFRMDLLTPDRQTAVVQQR